MSSQILLVVISLAVLWGSAFPAITLALAGLEAGHLTLLRHLIASLCYVPFLRFMGLRLFPERRDIPFFGLLGLLGTAIYHAALNYGQVVVPAGTSSLIIAVAPAFTTVLAFFILGDKLPVLGWLGFGVSFLGVSLLIFAKNGTIEFNPFALLILLSAVVTSFNTILQKSILKRYKAVEVIAFATWAGTLILMVFAPGIVQDIATAPSASLWACLYLGVVPSAIANAMFTFAISKAPVSLVSIFIYSVPVFSLLFSWLLLRELPSSLTLVGGLIVVVGIVMVNLSKRKAATQLVAAD